MKTKIIYFTVFIILFIACNEISIRNDIGIVKKYQIKSLAIEYREYSVDYLVKGISGLSGTTEWKSFKPNGYENNPNVVCVQVDIIRNADIFNVFKLQFLLNRETEYVELASITIDGVPHDFETLSMILARVGVR